VLIETSQIDELDQMYIDWRTEQGITDEEDFFIFERSIKLLARYLLKLSTWYNEVIYLFYFQILNLYYSYDAEVTLKQLREALAPKIDLSAAAIPSSTKLYSREFSLSPLFNDVFPYLTKAEESAQIQPS